MPWVVHEILSPEPVSQEAMNPGDYFTRAEDPDELHHFWTRTETGCCWIDPEVHGPFPVMESYQAFSVFNTPRFVVVSIAWKD